MWDLTSRKYLLPYLLWPGYKPGQIGFDPAGFAPDDPAEFRLMQVCPHAPRPSALAVAPRPSPLNPRSTLASAARLALALALA